MGRCGASGTSWIWGRRGRQMWAWLILLLMVIWEWEGGGNRLVSADLPKTVNFVRSNNENWEENHTSISIFEGRQLAKMQIMAANNRVDFQNMKNASSLSIIIQLSYHSGYR